LKLGLYNYFSLSKGMHLGLTPPKGDTYIMGIE